MHVAMEEAVAEHLGEEDLDAVAGELPEVDALLAHPVDLADGDAAYPLHHDHVLPAQVPVHLRDAQQVRVAEVAAQLVGVGRLADQVQLVVQVVVELVDDLQRPQPPRIGGDADGERAGGAQQAEVVLHHLGHAGAQHLDRHLPAVVQLRQVDLGDGGGRNRGLLELGEYVGDPEPQAALDLRHRQRCREGRHAVLEHRELVGDIRRHQVAPGGEHLAELHEDRSQALEGHPHAGPARLPTGAEAQQPGQPDREARADGTGGAGGDQLVETVAPADPEDPRQPDRTGGV